MALTNRRDGKASNSMLKRWRITIAAFTTALVTLTIPFLCNAQEKKPISGTTEKSALRNYLQRAGMRADCYFTLERDQRRINRASPFDGIHVEDDAGDVNADKLIARLQTLLPFAVVERNKSNPVVINIIESSLSNARANVMDETIDVKYTGTPSGLVEVVGKQLDGRLGRRRGGDLSRAFEDGITHVDVNAKRQTLRNVLTDYVPLTGYSRIVWEADTLDPEIEGKTETWVQYYGEGFSSDKQPISDAVIPFSEGEIAYARNAKTDETVRTATEYIASHISNQDKSQLRWAVLFLAKNKIVRSVPLLFKYLDYKYTSVPLIEESYPVVRALIEMGKPAASGALAQLGIEDDGLKLELLATVVLRVHGLDEGRRQIDLAAMGMPEARKQRLIDAVAKIRH
jgi:hypothetical protein